MARSVVDNVLQQLAQLINNVREQAARPMQTMLQQVTDGVWIGEGANKFVEEVSSILIPSINKVTEHISTTSTNVQNAREIIDRADEEVDKLVKSQMLDTFKFY